MAPLDADFAINDVNGSLLGNALEHVCSLGRLASPIEDHSDFYETVLHQVLYVCRCGEPVPFNPLPCSAANVVSGSRLAGGC